MPVKAAPALNLFRVKPIGKAYVEVVLIKSLADMVVIISPKNITYWTVLNKYHRNFPFWNGAIESIGNNIYRGFLAATKQLYEWFSPSVCPSVRHAFFYYIPIIMKFSWVIIIDTSNVHAKGQGRRSNVKVTEVKTQFSHFWTLTPVWIHMCQWNDAQSLMCLRRGALLFFKVIGRISRSDRTKNRPEFDVSRL